MDERAKRQLAWRSGLALCTVLASCVGTIGGNDDPSLGGPPDEATDSEPTDVVPQPICSDGAALEVPSDLSCEANPATLFVGEAPLRRLTNREYDSTIADLLGTSATPAQSFASEAQPRIGAAPDAVSTLLIEQYMVAAEQLAIEAMASPETLLPCDPATVTVEDEKACAQTFLEDFGMRAFRRPLSQSEIESHLELFALIRQDAGFSTAMEAVLQALLQSVHFLYRVELGGADPEEGHAVPLSAYELASRLSYFFWGTMPDEELFAAAAADELATPEQIEAQARRLLADKRARPTILSFYAQWVGVTDRGMLDKDTTIHPEFDERLAGYMVEEVQAYVRHILWAQDARLETLLTNPYTLQIHSKLSDVVYGYPVGTLSNGDPVPFDEGERSGLLSLSGVLAMHAEATQSSPILRGHFVREQLLCESLPSPPADLELEPVDHLLEGTTKEKFAQHSSDPSCSSCHRLMDPIGFGFEHFDAIGRYRSEEAGVAVDASGEIVATGATDPELVGPFVGLPELSERLAASDQVRKCVARQWFRYAFGRQEHAGDRCSVEAVDAVFAQTEGDLLEILIAITQTDAFRHRPRLSH